MKKTAIGIMAVAASMMYAQSKEYSLNFDSEKYTIKTAQVAGKEISFRAYEDVVYVSHPVDVRYQSMNIYIPVEYYEGKNIRKYNADTAPIFLPNDVGRYMSSQAGAPIKDRRTGKDNAILVALSKGYVVASPGARGRKLTNDKAQYIGKAPAAIVDLKAAVRYLRFNDKIMPGNAEKIISNGTSAGGALSALLGASGNQKIYHSYLNELGAAAVRDDIFAVSAYCPITNLDNADAAYEWQYGHVKDYKVINLVHPGYIEIFTETLTEEQIAVQPKLAAMFPKYVNSLKLKDENGKTLTLNEKGEGTFKEYIKKYVINSANKAISEGNDLSKYSWLEFKNKKVVGLDFKTYSKEYLRRSKSAPAFDALDLSAGENNLFGDLTVDNKHFTKFSFDNNTAKFFITEYPVEGGARTYEYTKAQMADADIVKMMNPMNFIKNTSTQNWRIRHGAKDADTSLAISTILATTLKNNKKAVDFAMPWDIVHRGDYDLEELFEWMDKISTK